MEVDRTLALGRNPTVSTQTSLRHPARPAQIPASVVLVDVVVLSSDPGLFEAIRNAVGERNPVWRARSAEESVELLLGGRCGVLVIDLGTVATDRKSLIEQIVAQFPDVVVVAAGRREDEALVASLISDGLIYRYMHKPLSAKRAGMFLGASMRQHVERRGQRLPDALPPHAARLPSRLKPWTWTLAVGGLVLVVALLAAWLGGPGRDSTQRNDASAPRPSVATPVPAAPKADPVLARARAALAAGRYESPPGRNALDLYAAVLLARPGHREARAGLDEAIARVAQQADRAAARGRSEEARRLLARLQSVDPGNDVVAALAPRLEPPPRVAATESPKVMPANRPETAPPPPPAPAPAPARPTADAAPPPATVPPTPVARAPLTRTPAVAPAPQRPGSATPKVVADPLTPRIVNAEALRGPTTRIAKRNDAADVFGPPASSGHPIAGYAGTTAPPEPAPAPVPAGAPAAETMMAGGAPLPVDDFQPLAVAGPVYPPEALRNKVEGWVTLEFTITETGVVRDVQVVEAEPRGVFDAAAAAAVGAWRFRPRSVNGRPVPQRSVVTLRFNVDG